MAAKLYPIPDVLNPMLVRRPTPKPLPKLSADALAWRLGVNAGKHIIVARVLELESVSR